jgi:hypothetical protein
MYVPKYPEADLDPQRDEHVTQYWTWHLDFTMESTLWKSKRPK